VVGQKRDDSASCGHLNEDREKHEDHRENRTVDKKQHHRDHRYGYRGDLRGALTAHFELIRGERRRAGDVGLDALRGLRVIDDAADGVDGLVGQRRTLIAGKIHLHVRGLAVRALRAGRREGVTPEVLDMLHVLLVLLELVDQGVVKPMRVSAQRLIAFDDDHRRAVGVELVEHLPDVFRRLKRRCIG
jgi:hypothetical protein